MNFTYYDKTTNKTATKNVDIEGIVLEALNHIDDSVDDELISSFLWSEVRANKAARALHDEVFLETLRELVKAFATDWGVKYEG